jgi:hypothetical protein
VNEVERRTLIHKYRNGHQVVFDALRDITAAELDAVPGPNEWSARQVVHHLADSEMTSAIRLRRLLAEEQPLIVAYDQAEFARRLHYDRPIEVSLEVLKAVRQASAEILERLSDVDWSREGAHSESGAYGVEDWLEIYAAHAHDHAAQIARARAVAS